MASHTVTAPSPQIFTSDPTEQIYARGTLDRDMSGLSFMLGNAAKMNRDQDQEAYMRGVSQANAQAMQLAQQEEMHKTMIEGLKQAVEMSKIGADPRAMPPMAMIGNQGKMDEAVSLIRLLHAAQANEANAKAAHAGDAGADRTTAEYQDTGQGVGLGTFKVQSRDPQRALTQAAKYAADSQRMRGNPVNPSTPLSMPATAGQILDQMKAKAAQRGQAISD